MFDNPENGLFQTSFVDLYTTRDSPQKVLVGWVQNIFGVNTRGLQLEFFEVGIDYFGCCPGNKLTKKEFLRFVVCFRSQNCFKYLLGWRVCNLNGTPPIRFPDTTAYEAVKCHLNDNYAEKFYTWSVITI